jgi:mannose-6-phosphate isomerase-like protein (cupin superfamily)
MHKSVLENGELKGGLTLLGPGAATSVIESAFDRVVYVAQGTVTAIVGPANFMLSLDETLQVSAGKGLSLRNHGSAPAKVLVITLPARRREPSTVVTF